MQKNKIPVFSIVVYCLALLLIAYSVWTAVLITSYLKESAVTFSGNEYYVVNTHLTNYGLFVVIAVLLFMSGWILQKITPKVEGEAKDEEAEVVVVEMEAEE